MSKRPASDDQYRQWYPPNEFADWPCDQCNASDVLRWWAKNNKNYCLGCWREYGSEAAEVLYLCSTDKSLRTAQNAKARFFRGPPEEMLIQESGKVVDSTNILLEVTPEDSLSAANRLLQERYNKPSEDSLPPLVLNMANAEYVGGGFLRGACGQEEDLCRRSNLFQQLTAAESAGFYPIPDLGCVLLPEVRVFRDSADTGYKRLADPFSVAVITAAAPCNPSISTAEEQEAYAFRMEAKVKSLLAVIRSTGYRDIVLSAWGCGAFRNPPKEVARIFGKVLRSQKENICGWRRIVFAVFDRPDWAEGNYAVFRKALIEDCAK